MSKRRRHTGRCVACGTIVRGEFHGKPYHSQRCAYVLLARILESIPGVVDLLPRQWRADLPPEPMP